MMSKFKLNPQLFAEPEEGDSGENEPGAQGGNVQIDYSKIEENCKQTFITNAR